MTFKATLSAVVYHYFGIDLIPELQHFGLYREFEKLCSKLDPLNLSLEDVDFLFCFSSLYYDGENIQNDRMAEILAANRETIEPLDSLLSNVL